MYIFDVQKMSEIHMYVPYELLIPTYISIYYNLRNQ